MSLGFITPTETTARVPRLSELSVSVLTLLLPGCKNDNKHCKMGEEGGWGGSGVLTLSQQLSASNPGSRYPAKIILMSICLLFVSLWQPGLDFWKIKSLLGQVFYYLNNFWVLSEILYQEVRKDLSINKVFRATDFKSLRDFLFFFIWFHISKALWLVIFVCQRTK